MKNKILIVTSILILVIIALWFSGIIPKQIGKICGTNYMKEKFPKMQLEYVDIEWNKYYGDYIITFKDKTNQNYGCVIGPKYFPINIGQGIFIVEEKYSEKYSSINTIPPYVPDGVEIADNSAIRVPVDSLTFNREIKNVTIEVLKDTVTNKSLEILITDNNQDYYGWGVDFRIQQKINEEWQELKYLSDDLSWIEIGCLPDKNNQIKQKLNIEKYYGELSNGTYRVVKSVYDKGYVDIYSDEFEIK